MIRKRKKKNGVQMSYPVVRRIFFKCACSHASCWSLLSPPRLSHSLRCRTCCHLPTTRSFRWEPRMTRRRCIVEMLPIGARARNQYSPNMITTKSRTVSLPLPLSLPIYTCVSLPLPLFFAPSIRTKVSYKPPKS